MNRFNIEKRLERIERILCAIQDSYQPQNQDKAFLNVDEAAQLLRLTTSTIYSKCSRQEIPHIRKSRKLYFKKQDLLDYVLSGEKTKTEKQIQEEVDEHLARIKKG